MRVSYTSLAVAALLFLTACGTNSPDIVAPGNASANTVAGDGGGAGLIGSGNAIAQDTTGANNLAAERGGIGLLGSGN